jgi:hypothetical protein
VPAAPAVVRPVQPAPSSPASPPLAAPAPPKITAQAPPHGIELQPGTPASLPITVRNEGSTVSEPVVIALALPPGITPVPAGGGGGTAVARSAPSSAPAAVDSVLVRCPGGTGTVTCRTETGLAPGQAAVLNFRLLSDDTAQPGTLTGTVTAGAQVNLSVSVKVNVKPAPDAVDLNLWVVLHHRPQTDDGVTVTAKVGQATATLHINCGGPVGDLLLNPRPSLAPGTTTSPSSPSTPFIRTGH